MKIKFLGSGDAFGSGGRLQTCILLETNCTKVLMDCGASSQIAMRTYKVNPNEIDAILITHLHGDHFGGIPFFILDAQLISKRTTPLVIAGPPGTRQRILELMEAMFPGSSKIQQKFTLDIREVEMECPAEVAGIRITSYLVSHPSGNPSTALRLEAGDKIITYTGDAEWSESFVRASRGAALFIAESYFFDRKVKFHLDYQTLMEHQQELQIKRLILTHMGENMLANLADISCDYAYDGKIIEV